MHTRFLGALSAIILSIHPGIAAVVANFETPSVTASQRAGVLLIPVDVTGTFTDSFNTYLSFYEQDITATHDVDFSGVDPYLQYSQPDFHIQELPTTFNVSIPIRYTGSTADKTFLVTMNPGGYTNNINVGAANTISVTILGEPAAPSGGVVSPGGATITTKKGNTGFLVVRGHFGASDASISKVKVVFGGVNLHVRGKSSWSASIYVKKAGAYVVTAKATLAAGGTLTTKKIIRVH